MEILNYKEKEIAGLLDWLPYFPWEGPPLPKFFPPWPWAAKKWIRKMTASVIPFSIPQVDVYVFSAKMVGTYKGTIKNLGEIALTSGNLVQTLDILKYTLLNRVQKITPFVEPECSEEVEFTFTVEGVWDVIKELWDYLWNREIDVDTVADLYILGRSEADYDVEPLSKRYEIQARLKVDELNWHAWG